MSRNNSKERKLADLAREAGPAVGKELKEISKEVVKEFARWPSDFLQHLFKS